MNNWQDDIKTLLLLRTKKRPKRTRHATIVRGVDVPLEVSRKLERFMALYFNSYGHRYNLDRGNDFTVTTLVHGFDIDDISPPIETGRGILERLGIIRL